MAVLGSDGSEVVVGEDELGGEEAAQAGQELGLADALQGEGQGHGYEVSASALKVEAGE
jgi:hypothetical protein